VTNKSTLAVVANLTNLTKSEASAALTTQAGTNPLNRQQYQIVGSYLAA
jgi:hypothetical protein